MKFTFETEYNKKAVKNMAYLMRKTIRKKKDNRSRVWGIVIFILAIFLTLPVIKGDSPITFNTVITWVAAFVVLFTLIFQDSLNSYFARRRMLSGSDKATVIFENEKYISETPVGKTEFNYDIIHMVAENEDYFIFILDERYAQIYDKNKLTGGTLEEFRNFIAEKTKKPVLTV